MVKIKPTIAKTKHGKICCWFKNNRLNLGKLKIWKICKADGLGRNKSLKESLMVEAPIGQKIFLIKK